MASPVTGKDLRARERLLRDLSRRGVRGGTIDPHRAMLSLPDAGQRLASSILLVLLALAGYIAVLPWIGRLWLVMVERADAMLGIGGPVEARSISLLGVLDVTLPAAGFEAQPPSARALAVAGGVAAVLILGSLALRGRWLPAAYFIRALAVVLLSAVGYFAFWPDRFPYAVPEYVVGHLATGMVLMGLVPPVLGFTFYLFDLNLARKLLLTVMILGHLTVFLPLQAVLHAWLISHLSLVVMPVLVLLFGTLLDVMVFVAFYGWAMSWPSSLWEEPRRR